MTQFAEHVPDDFQHPTQLPADAAQAEQWQKANREFWENNPMRYDWKEGVGSEEFSRAFFEEIDRRFLDRSREMLPYRRIPFDGLIDFESLKDKDVLEIGVGNGSHASLLAQHARSFTGVDLTEYAVRSTSARFGIFNLPGRIVQMDAENLEFADGSFDYVWSWGVIHHSSNTRRILEQIRRVLRPGGRADIMVYNRSFHEYWVMAFLMHGLVRGKLFKARSINRVLQQTTDGALARYYTSGEWRALAGDLFEVEQIRKLGNKPEFWPIPGGRIKSLLLRLTPDALSRFYLNTLGQGMFLFARMVRPMR